HGWGRRSSRPPYRLGIRSAQRGPAEPLSSGFGSRGTAAPGLPGFADTAVADPAVFPRPEYQTPVRRLPRNIGHPAPAEESDVPAPAARWLPPPRQADDGGR